jgi:tetratricopeptide (TPR) repeat protein
MDSDDWLRLRAAFERLVETPPDLRAAALERECAGDDALRSRLVRLLEADGSDALVLGGPPSLEGLLEGPGSGLAPGTVLGPYVLVEPIAAGGMGTVWLAEQAQPRRRVAVKTLRAEITGPEALKRFRAEAELLAHLSHPGIAQVFGAGTALLDGRSVPYIAMEYVEGSHGLCEWADARGLDVRARLRLFIEACAAVHHGHVRGVIHRDLKPGNILVDPLGRPKVIDFGLARALDAGALQVSVARTRAGDVLGTFAYMSPEHVGGEAWAVDARSDVYALGCILCELVTGRPPIAVDGLPLAEVARRIAEQPPAIADVRPADLRWVLHKALEKAPARRYASASELSADVQRVLDGSPILARPPSTLYELGKLARRHRALLAATAAVLLALAVGLVQARRAAHAAERARADAQRKAALAQITSQFLDDAFQFASVYELGREARVADAVAYAEQRLSDIADPTARAVLSSVVGRAWMRLEERPRGQPLLLDSVEELRASLPPEDFFRLRAEVVLADLLELEQRFEESRELSLRVLPVLEGSLGVEDPLAYYLRMNLGICEFRLGRHERAEELFRADLARCDARGDPQGTRIKRRDLHHWIGSCLLSRGQPDESLAELETALELGRGAGLAEASIHVDIGRVWQHLSEPELALESFADARALHQTAPASAISEFAVASNMADALRSLGRHVEAREELDRAGAALAKGWRTPGLRHLILDEQRAHLALESGSPQEAERIAQTILELARELSLGESLQAAGALQLVARARLELGRPGEALEPARESLAMIERLGATHGRRYVQAKETLERARAGVD